MYGDRVRQHMRDGQLVPIAQNKAKVISNEDHRKFSNNKYS